MEKEMEQQGVEIADPEKIKVVVKKMKEGGPARLHVLADFDRTLTTARVDGRPMPSMISILRDGNYLTPDYAERAHALFNHYHPIEKDPNVTVAEKKKAMEEWWRTHFKLLVECGLTKSDVEAAVNAGKIRFRSGVAEFLKILQEKNIPIVIMSSSGLGGDAIGMCLQKEGRMSDNIQIVGNSFIWGADGKALGVTEPIIHGMNKDETLIQNFSAYEQIKGRPNVLLLGDNPGDTGMVEGFDYDNLLKIGFLNDDLTADNLGIYKKEFDAVITGDGSFDYVNKLINEILNK